MYQHLVSQLQTNYDERESANIAEVLFDVFKGWRKSEIVMHSSENISESEMLKFHFALKKLKLGVPVQYVVGEAWFYGLKFLVNQSVLIPRPETEELVQWIIEENKNLNPGRLLDIGTGSGCIAISLKKHLAKWEVHAADVSEDALEQARINAKLNEVEIALHHRNILKDTLGDGVFDIIVSNPPYIPVSEKTSMSPHVVNHEPSLALFVENDNPLLFYDRIIHLAKSHNQRCTIYFEIHFNAKEALHQLASSYAPLSISFKQDMQGKDRMMKVCF